MNLFANAIDPLEEMVAYEAFHAREKTTFTKVARELVGYTSPSAGMTTLPADLIENTRTKLETLKGFRICVAGDFHFPERLSDDPSPPPLMYFRGDIGLLESPMISIVGARSAGRQGLDRARKMAKLLVQQGFTIVSGLAKGIDTAALKAAMNEGGNVVAVIGTPIDRIYPKENADLQEEIAKKHLLISEVPFIRYSQEHFNYHSQYFPLRNRIMSGISKATVIIEASEKSGTLTQARAAIQQGRKLFILNSCFENPAITWPAFYEKKGAIRVHKVEDVLSNLEK